MIIVSVQVAFFWWRSAILLRCHYRSGVIMIFKAAINGSTLVLRDQHGAPASASGSLREFPQWYSVQLAEQLAKKPTTLLDFFEARNKKCSSGRQCVLNGSLMQRDLEGGNLNGAIFSNVNVSGLDFSNRDLRRTIWQTDNNTPNNAEYARFINATLAGSVLTGHFNNADFSGAIFFIAPRRPTPTDRGADGARSILLGFFYFAQFDGAQLNRCGLIGEFPGASFRNAKMQYALLKGNFSQANFSGADLRGANMRVARLVGADLRGADLHQANLQGAVYSQNTKFPIGFNPNKAGMRLERSGTLV
jgi:uncharacterized protein YjbI with pentapeptide repeats